MAVSFVSCMVIMSAFWSCMSCVISASLLLMPFMFICMTLSFVFDLLEVLSADVVIELSGCDG